MIGNTGIQRTSGHSTAVPYKRSQTSPLTANSLTERRHILTLAGSFSPLTGRYSRPFQFSSKVPSDGMFEEYSIFEMMDTTGGKLCYVYQ
jgi:hypothetical protein